MINEIDVIIRKNIIRLTRSKTSSMIIILGPFFLILLLGFGFNNLGLYGIKVGVHAAEQNDKVEMIVDSIKGHDFSVITYPEKNACIDDVKDGKMHLCLSFLPAVDQQTLEFHVDYSKLNLVYTLLNILSYSLSEKSTEISLGLTQDMLDKLKSTSDSLKQDKDIIMKLQKDAQEMGIKINSIRMSIDGINTTSHLDDSAILEILDEVNSSKEELTEFKTNVTSSLKESEKGLESLGEKVSGSKEDLTSERKELASFREEAAAIIEAAGCPSPSSHLDLLDFEELESLNSAGCQELYSSLDVLDGKIALIDQIIEDLESLIESIDSAKIEIAQAEIDLDMRYNRTWHRISDLEGKFYSISRGYFEQRQQQEELILFKDSLNRDLIDAESLLTATQKSYERFNQNYDGMVSKLDSMTFTTPSSIVKPIVTEVSPIVSERTGFDYLFPSVLAIIIMFVSVLLSSTIIMKEKSSRAYFRNFITPSSGVFFIIGTFATALMVVSLQAVIILIVATLFFSISVSGSIIFLIISILLVSSLFILIGMIIGYLLKNEETSTITSIILSCILLLFSSIIIPIERMKGGASFLAKMNPLVISESVIRQIIFYEPGIAQLARSVLLLLSFIILLFLLTIGAKNLWKHSIEE